MAQRSIIWSHRAKIRLFEIMEFYAERNKSKVYSAKIYSKFNKELHLLLRHPDLGIKTEISSVRGLIIGNFILFYEQSTTTIIVHTVWDSRQNPTDLVIK